MQILVAGMDPSFKNWGMAEGRLDLATGFLDVTNLQCISTEKSKVKQVRQNSDDMQRCFELAEPVIETAKRVKVIFVECPVGSQNASGMKAYGLSVMLLGVLRALGYQVIEVTASEVKKALTGNKNATKAEMIEAAVALYPEANWPMHRGKIVAGTAEHMADSLGAIHAGVNTPVFLNLLQLYKD